ncbi:hypothetical protein BD779DRAFT_1538381 [Infundibulicybe gibba]|nr:hypothetical protein BD779DRAFT_1538381 [Infundibulicybe gibba]
MSTTIRAPGVLDTNFATKSIVLVGWVLDKPIEPEKVEAAWGALNNAWPVLSARLRHNKNKWEYHIPTSPHTTYSFGRLSLDGSIHEHYEYSSPAKTISCSKKTSPLHLYMPYGPRSMKDIVNCDRAVAHLHVTTFADGSLVGLAIPHVVSDAGGLAAIIHALEGLINGGPPPAPQDSVDPYASYAMSTTQDVPAPPNWRLVNIAETISVYVQAIWTELFGAAMENRDIYFPAEDVKRIKSDAMEDIRKEHGKDTNLWVSSSDAILAFCLKCAHVDTYSSAPLNVFYTANIRKLFGLPSTFMHNSVAYIITDTLPLSSIPTISLGALALHIRKTIEVQTTKPAVEKWLRWRLVNEGKLQICFDPWRGKWQITTNWREMDLLKIDYSGGLEKGGPGEVRCKYLWMDGLGPVLRNWIGLIADEPDGGLWVAGTFSKQTWEDRRGFGKFIHD